VNYIGADFKARMDLFNYNISSLSEKSFVEEDIIQAILDNNISYDEIDEFDLNLLCSLLHCRPEYFINEKIRNNDLLIGSKNRGVDNDKSRDVKAKIQDFVNDFIFLQGFAVN
jgi:hypothetical protein